MSAGPAWLVLPTYNEAGNVESFVAAVCGKLPASARILIVDDNSPDGTGEIADRLAASGQHIEVLHRPRKEGLGPAYIAGFRHALAHGAGYVLEMDADFSHDPAYLPRLLEAGVRDLTGGFKCFRREVLEAIDLDSISSRGYAFQIEMTYRAIQLGFEVVEVPIVFRERRAGKSKMDRSIVAEAIWRVPAMRLRDHRS